MKPIIKGYLEVYDVDFTRALPQPLKNDETMLSLGRAIAGELQQNIQLARHTLIYPRIDELDDQLLDILAVDLKVDWYDFNGTLEEKRKAVKECIYVHRYKGTKYAVETALKSIYANVVVSEWFEYCHAFQQAQARASNAIASVLDFSSRKN